MYSRGCLEFITSHDWLYQQRRSTVDLKSEIDRFVTEFSEVESHCVGEALRSLSADRDFVERSERILDHHARFTLLRRMASVRNLSPDVLSELDGADLRAAELREKRDELARTLSSIEDARMAPDVWIPTIAEIEKCRMSTATLQATLEAITRQVARSSVGF
jgi:hypothetical protein